MGRSRTDLHSPRDWQQLIRLPDEELVKIDVAVLNLACAVGLPGSERMNAGGCLRALDDWAVGVRDLTERALATEFRRAPERYDRCEPLFRLVRLVHLLQVACGVRYNPAKIAATPHAGILAEDEFIFGVIQGPGGTCASLPVVITAAARRLGYPVYLAWTKGHCFCRWDDPQTGVRVNIEVANNTGVNTYSDSHYRKWPEAFDAREEVYYGYLRSLSPREELASFLEARALVLEHAGASAKAIDALHAAVEVDAHPYPRYLTRLRQAGRRWGSRLRARGLIGHGFAYPREPAGPRRWPELPWAWEAELLALEAAEEGKPCPGVPTYLVWDGPRGGRAVRG